MYEELIVIGDAAQFVKRRELEGVARCIHCGRVSITYADHNEQGRADTCRTVLRINTYQQRMDRGKLIP